MSSVLQQVCSIRLHQAEAGHLAITWDDVPAPEMASQSRTMPCTEESRKSNRSDAEQARDSREDLHPFSLPGPPKTARSPWHAKQPTAVGARLVPKLSPSASPAYRQGP